MSTNFPTSIDDGTSLPNPAAGDKTNSPSHAGLHDSENAAIIAVETKMGTGSSSPSNNTILRGSGSGASTWGTITSTQLAAIVSDETGTGVLVFGTTPTLTTPTLTNPTVTTGTFASPALTTPTVATSINDTNGNEIIKTPATGSAVNEITVTNAATTAAPTIGATGGDSNIDLNLIGKGTGSARFAGPHDGWVAANETWTYASATTFTCSANLIAQIQTGDKLKLTQTTIKYFSVVSTSGTTVTLTGGTDYTLANAAITAPFYSHEASPAGFPTWFAYTATITGNSATPTNNCYFAVDGHSCTFIFNISGTSNATGFAASIPITAFTLSGYQSVVIFDSVDNGTAGTGSEHAAVASGGTTIIFAHNDNNSGWTSSGAKAAFGTIIYRI